MVRYGVTGRTPRGLGGAGASTGGTGPTINTTMGRGGITGSGRVVRGSGALRNASTTRGDHGGGTIYGLLSPI